MSAIICEHFAIIFRKISDIFAYIFPKNRQFQIGKWVRKFGENFANILRKNHWNRQFLMRKWCWECCDNFFGVRLYTLDRSFVMHAQLVCCAPSQLVLSFYASGPTGGLPTAFGCLRCHSFYLSVTPSPMAVCVHFYCYQWCIAFHSHLIADTSTSGPISWWYSCIRTHHRIA